MQVPLESPRYKIENFPRGIHISIPSQKNWFGILFLMAWLGGWFFGEVSVISSLLNPQKDSQLGFMFFWLIGWTIGGVMAVLWLCWQVAGIEVIEIQEGSLIRRILIGGIGITREEPLTNVKNLRLMPVADSHAQIIKWGAASPLGNTIGPLGFDYGARTYKFGGHLDEAEARGVLEHLNPYLPNSKLIS